MSAFRAAPRSLQVHLLEQATSLGVCVFEHYVAHYHAHEGYYVALCSTLDGIDFTSVFASGHEYRWMLDVIALEELGRNGILWPPTAEEARKARVEEAAAERAAWPHKTHEELMDSFREQGLQEGYLAARERNLHLGFLRLLEGPQLSYLSRGMRFLDIGVFTHYSAHYFRIDDLYMARCTTNDGTDFQLVYRDGPAYDHMRSVVKPEELA